MEGETPSLLYIYMMMKVPIWARSYVLLLASFLLAFILVWSGFKETETREIIGLVINLSVTMAGFGLVAFQIARASSELKNDFLESSILMILSTIFGFFFLVYPDKSLLGLNFGELSMFVFFWAFILFLVVLVDKRFNVLN